MILLKEVQKILSESYNGKKNSEFDIVYEDGHPYNYFGEFKNLWMIHMKYIQSIQKFPLPKVTSKIFSESLKRFISKHEDTKLFVAKENNEMIGFLQAGMLMKKHYGFISDLHVIEDYRRFGVGSRLLKNCFQWYNKNDIKEISIEVTGGNKKVIDFYKKNGFEIDSYILKKEKS